MKKERRFNPSLPNSSYIFLIVFLFFGITVEKFWSPGNLSTLLLQASVLLTIAMGMAIVIMSGGVDLSVGGTISLSAVVAGTILKFGGHWILALLGAFATGIVIGFLNGIVIQKMKVVPFITTFGMANIAQSLANVISQKRTVYWDQLAQNEIIKTLSGNIFSKQLGSYDLAVDVISISYISLVSILVMIAINVAFKKTRLGVYVYAIGKDQESARLSGIKTDAWVTGVYMLSGFLASIAGVMLLIRTQSVQPTLGEGLEFYAVVSAVLGGNSLKGGKGSIGGAILGAFVLYTIRSALTLEGVSTFWVLVTIGSVLIVGMVINNLVDYFERKAQLRVKLQQVESGLAGGDK